MMKHILTITLALLLLALPAAARSKQDIYALNYRDAAGQQQPMRQHKGKVLLIVNTATRCGFTPQYNELQALHKKYAGRGLVILDFPCNQFGQQAPGTIQEIQEFCTANFSTAFPQQDKVDVNGAGEAPLFTFLKAAQPFKGFDLSDKTGKFMDQMLRKQDPDYAQKPDIKWNFTKFLVDRKGNVVRRFEPTESMTDIDKAIEALMK